MAELTRQYYGSVESYHDLAEASHGNLVMGKEDLVPFVKSSGLVLDVAGGTGFNAELLGIQSDRYVVVDFSHIGLCQVLERQRGFAIASDVGVLPFRDNLFSTVLCSWSLEHFEEPERALTEMIRVCEKAAKIIIWGPNWDNIFRKDFPQFAHKPWWYVQRTRWNIFFRMLRNEFLPFRYKPFVNPDVAAFHDSVKYVGGDTDAVHCSLCQETMFFFREKGLHVVHVSDFSRMSTYLRNGLMIRVARLGLKPFLPILRVIPLVRWFVIRFPIVVEKL